MVFQVLSNSNPSISIHLAVNSSREFKEPRSSPYKNIYFSAIQSACSFQNAPIGAEIGFFVYKFTYMLAEGRRLYGSLFEGRFVLVVSGLE